MRNKVAGEEENRICSGWGGAPTITYTNSPLRTRPFQQPARGVAEKLERPGKVGRSEPMEAGFTGGLPRICRGPRNLGHAIPMHIPERDFSAGLLGGC